MKLPKDSVVHQDEDIPLKDGDNMILVLMMAVAEANDGELLLRLPESNTGILELPVKPEYLDHTSY